MLLIKIKRQDLLPNGKNISYSIAYLQEYIQGVPKKLPDSGEQYIVVSHDGLFQLKMLQIAESFIHLTFSTIFYYFH